MDNIKKTIKEISLSMSHKGYDPVKQISGYLISNDIGYIPDFDDNRNRMLLLDKETILEEMIKEYLRCD